MSRRADSAFHFALDLHTGVPVYRQIIDRLRAGVASGALTAGVSY